MMLLVDIGNTRVKWSLWGQGRHESMGDFTHAVDGLARQLDHAWSDLGTPERVVVANVAGPAFENAIQAWVLTHWSLSVTFEKAQARALGVTNAYADAASLGVDRWMTLIAVRHSMRGAACVVDCGSAITVDVLSDDGMHCGGWIAPGLEMMRRVLMKNTQGIGNFAPQADASVDLARATGDGVRAGTLLAAGGFVERGLRAAQRRCGPNVAGVLTGGDAPVLLALLDAPFRYEPHLVLSGLAIVAEAAS